MALNRELWNDYRATWITFSRRLDELQTLTEAGEQENAGPIASGAVRPEVIRAARQAVEDARRAHNAARDRLAAHLAPVPRDENRVRETAHLLWEFAGKPAGTAELDWHRAERLLTWHQEDSARSTCAAAS